METHKVKFKFENTLGEKMEMTLKVKERAGNVTFVTMCNHLRRFLDAFPDVRNIKENFAKTGQSEGGENVK